MMIDSRNSHANTIATMAAGKLLAKALGGRWGPAILIIAGIVLLKRRAAAKASDARRMGTDGVEATGA